jgi:hypothetical protein
MSLLGIALWIIFVWKMQAMKPLPSLGMKIQHGIFTFIFIGLNASFRMLGWMAGNYDTIAEHFYVSIGFFPAWVILTSKISYTIVDAWAFFVGFSLLKRKNWARRNILVIIPVLAILTPIEMLFGANKPEPISSMHEFFGLFITFTIVSISFHIWMYKFYNSESVKKVIMEN